MNDPIIVFAIVGLILAPAILAVDLFLRTEVGARVTHYLGLDDDDDA